jgi:hypothetical protein
MLLFEEREVDDGLCWTFDLRSSGTRKADLFVTFAPPGTGGCSTETAPLSVILSAEQGTDATATISYQIKLQ